LKVALSEQCACGAAIQYVGWRFSVLLAAAREWRENHIHEASSDNSTEPTRVMGFIQPKDEEEFVVHRPPEPMSV
jgi:hypothetical protein